MLQRRLRVPVTGVVVQCHDACQTLLRTCQTYPSVASIRTYLKRPSREICTGGMLSSAPSTALGLEMAFIFSFKARASACEPKDQGRWIARVGALVHEIWTGEGEGDTCSFSLVVNPSASMLFSASTLTLLLAAASVSSSPPFKAIHLRHPPNECGFNIRLCVADARV